MNFSNKIEQKDIYEIVNSKNINWDFFKNSTILVTGATGLIGFQTILSLLYANFVHCLNIKIVALARNKKKAQAMFKNCYKDNLKFVYQNIEKPLKYNGNIDYIIHTANTTSSREMTEKPVETIDSIVQGTKNILDFAKNKHVKSIVYLSSMEVYGDIPLEREKPLKEDDYGYINIMKPRSSYPVGKKTAESLCSAYFNEYKLPVKIARLAQTIGSGVEYNDGRVFAEFARCIIEKRDIVLKTSGEAIRSYIYITDAVSAILSMLEKGKNGESYNIANPDTTCSIAEMAEMLCRKYTTSNLVKHIDDKFYPNAAKYFLDTAKFSQDTAWKPIVTLEEAFKRLIEAFSAKRNLKKDDTKRSFFKFIFDVKNEGVYKVFKILNFTYKIPINVITSFLFRNISVKPNKILFNNFSGLGYGCNPKYIAEEILKRKLPYELVWLYNSNEVKNQKSFPRCIKKIKYSIRSIKEFASSKVIISNVHLNKILKLGWRKKDEQTYFQTWHGSLGIKKIDNSIKSNSNLFFNPLKKKLIEVDINTTDYLLSNSTFEDNVYREGLSWNKETLKIGHPRNDIFFKTKEELAEIRAKVCKVLNIPENKKIVLYAPSFRDNGKSDCYNLDSEKLKNALKQKFGNDWAVVWRVHPNMAEDLTFTFPENIINASYYPDIQELLVAADVGITDYSSWIFDFMLSKKPAFIYAEDITNYNNDRGFYYPIEQTPFPISNNNNELVNNIQNFNDEQYKINVQAFLEDKGCMEDGHAAERIVDLIENIMSK